MGEQMPFLGQRNWKLFKKRDDRETIFSKLNSIMQREPRSIDIWWPIDNEFLQNS